MEFRGDAIARWGMGLAAIDGNRDHIRASGTRICWAEWLHNSLAGWHCCILYTDDEFAILGRHADYSAVSQIWGMAHLTDAEVLALNGGHLIKHQRDSCHAPKPSAD